MTTSPLLVLAPSKVAVPVPLKWTVDGLVKTPVPV
jgi:hypothetical protein